VFTTKELFELMMVGKSPCLWAIVCLKLTICGYIIETCLPPSGPKPSNIEFDFLSLVIEFLADIIGFYPLLIIVLHRCTKLCLIYYYFYYPLPPTERNLLYLFPPIGCIFMKLESEEAKPFFIPLLWWLWDRRGDLGPTRFGDTLTLALFEYFWLCKNLGYFVIKIDLYM
jgi:hypothetical protein